MIKNNNGRGEKRVGPYQRVTTFPYRILLHTPEGKSRKQKTLATAQVTPTNLGQARPTATSIRTKGG